MTPPDPPEETPSALSRLERALAGFGGPKHAPDPEPAEQPEPEPEVEPSPVAETEPADEVEPDEEAEAQQWASPANSVLDIASAVAAVEQLAAAPVPPVSDAIETTPSDPDSLVLAATAAGTATPVRHEPEFVDEDHDVEDQRPPAPIDLPDLRARIHDFAHEGEQAAADEPEAGEGPEQEEPGHEVEPVEPLALEEPESPEDAQAAADARVADAAAAWQRNIGDTTLPYFLVDEEPPAPVAAPPLPTASVQDLREAIVSPREETKPRAPSEPKATASLARTVAEIPVLLIVAALIAFLVKTFLAQAYYIPSGSMIPQLQINDRVVVSKLTYKVHDPRRGDIIVFDDPRTGDTSVKTSESLIRKVGEGIGIVQPSTDEFIKRVIGLPGETVEGKNGHVYINGHELLEPYLKPSVITSDFPKVTVQPGRLWVMGDNRTGSADSRVFGQIKISTIVGRALVKVWPLDHASFL